MERANRKIAELVADNPETAAALHFLGIHFYNYTEQTLAEVCEERGLNPKLVIKKFNEVSQIQTRNIQNLIDYTPDVIIEFLKHNHFIFIKKRLPYLSDLMSKITSQHSETLVELQLIFPFFLEEFIHHIYEEEDQQFSYILKLYHFETKGVADEVLYQELEKHSVGRFHEAHTHETGLQGIRELTNNFSISENAPLHEKVILTTLKSFDVELNQHALLENEVLFPKARKLEQKILQMLAHIAV